MGGIIPEKTTAIPGGVAAIAGPLQSTDSILLIRGSSTYIGNLALLLAWINENIEGVDLAGYVAVSSIINTLTSTSTTAPLAAAQGKVLKDLVDALTTVVSGKLDASSYNEHFKGVHASLSALNTAIPSASAGDYATLDSGTGSAARLALWDADDSVWVDVGTVSLSTTDALTEGSSNLYFTSVRAVAAVASSFLRFDIAQTLNSTQRAQAHENLGTFDPNTSTKTASYVLNAADNDGKAIIRMNVASANTVTVNSSLIRPITIRQAGAGITTLVADGVTLNGNLVFAGVNDSKTIVPVSPGVYDVYGAL